MSTIYELVPELNIKLKLPNIFNHIHNSIELFNDLTKNILDNKNINIIHYEHTLLSLIGEGINPYNALYNIINTFTKNISKTFNDKINDNTFTNDDFINSYYNFIKSCLIIKKIFTKIDNYINKKNNYCIILFVAKYSFFENVMFIKYNDNYIIKYLDLSKEYIKNDFKKYIRVIKVFNTLSNFISSKLKEFKYDCLKLNDYITKDIINIVLNTIDKYFININKDLENIDNEQKRKIFNETYDIIDSINIFSNMEDNEYFIVNYKNKLYNRLLNHNTFNIENISIESISKTKSNLEIFIIMKLMINDLNISNIINKIYTKTNINFTSDKYKNIKKDIIKNIKTNIKYLSSELWNTNNIKPTYTLTNYNLELNAFIDIYKIITYNIHSEKSFDINFEMSSVDFDYNINKSTYNIKSNITQCSILSKINEYNDGIDINELLNYIGVNNDIIGYNINSLLKEKLILKNLENNKCILSINKNFISDNKFIDLIKSKNDIFKFMEMRKLFDENICKNTILEYFTNNKSSQYSLQNINDYILNKNISAYNYEIIKYLDELINSNLIIKNNDLYSFNHHKIEFNSDNYENNDDVEIIEVIEEIEVEEGEEGEEIIYEEVEEGEEGDEIIYEEGEEDKKCDEIIYEEDEN